MSIPRSIKRYTVQEYYDLERIATYKSDYYDGEIFAMAGGSIRHARICTNLVKRTGNRLEGKPCAEYESNLRLKIKATGLRTYPDMSVYCGPFVFDDEDASRETVTNPTAIFEVLSPSTEAYDRGLKWAGYRRIDSLRLFALISQETPHVELYERQADGSWRFEEFHGLDAVLPLRAIDIDLPLAEIYDKVDFTRGDGVL